MFKHVLVPTDGSPLSESAVSHAVNFARSIQARVTFFYAQPDFPMPIYGEGALIDPTTPEQFARSVEAEAQAILSKAKAVADSEGVDAATDTVVNEVPYEAVIDAADRHGCDLIFMASHGRRGLASLLLGSETQKVLTHSKIPVLVYR
ncbi:MAG: universal stress protein [Thauera sp.]|jgi:nucleotide-binding universal stress UspA family protein|nr:universal stress protein [Thauera sp.]